MASMWRTPPRHVLLYACGSVLVFGSWFASNVMSSHWLEELQDRERVLTSITLTDISRGQWLREYNMQVEAKRSRELTALAAYHLLADTEQVLAGIYTSLEDDRKAREQIIAAKNARVAKAEAWLHGGKYELVVQELNRVQDQYDREAMPETQRAMLRWEQARFSSQKWSFSFLVLYIAGVCLISVGFVLQEFREPSNQASQPPAQGTRRG